MRAGVEMKYSVYDRSFPGLGRTRTKDGDYKIYVLVDPRDQTVRYVGVTRNPARRRHGHRSIATAHNRLMDAWKEELHDLGLYPLMAVVDSACSEACVEREAYWIRYYRRRGRLNNVFLAGGDSGLREPTDQELDDAIRRLRRARNRQRGAKIDAINTFLVSK